MLRILKNALSFLLFAGVLLVLVGLARPANADPIEKVLKAADTATLLPQLSLAEVAAQVANAPVD